MSMLHARRALFHQIRKLSSSGESLDESHRNILQGGEVLGYQFEPRRDSNNGSGESADIEDDQNMSTDEDGSVVRLGNLDW